MITDRVIETFATEARKIIAQAQEKADGGMPLDQVLVWLIAGIGACIGIAERDAYPETNGGRDPTPVASDLRERARNVVDDWIGDGTGWVDTELKELQDIIYEQFVSIRAKARAEGFADSMSNERSLAPGYRDDNACRSSR